MRKIISHLHPLQYLSKILTNRLNEMYNSLNKLVRRIKDTMRETGFLTALIMVLIPVSVYLLGKYPLAPHIKGWQVSPHITLGKNIHQNLKKLYHSVWARVYNGVYKVFLLKAKQREICRITNASYGILHQYSLRSLRFSLLSPGGEVVTW